MNEKYQLARATLVLLCTFFEELMSLIYLQIFLLLNNLRPLNIKITVIFYMTVVPSYFFFLSMIISQVSHSLIQIYINILHFFLTTKTLFLLKFYLSFSQVIGIQASTAQFVCVLSIWYNHSISSLLILRI